MEILSFNIHIFLTLNTYAIFKNLNDTKSKVKNLKITNSWKLKFYITVKYYIGKSSTYNLYQQRSLNNCHFRNKRIETFKESII